MLARGESTGVFQFESSGMREALRQVKPTEFEDLIALVALYRPGPMRYIPVYARRKNGQEPVTYIDERLKAITGDSYGICIYQEQYMEIAKQIAGFSPAEADDLRKAIGKKIHELMASLKDKFLEGCARERTSRRRSRSQLWKDMEQSQDYSFNKSHAACYALIAYRTAWLKANHPREYMAALISSVMNTKDRVPFYVNACDEIGIEVLPPDVNESQCRLRRRRGEDPLRPERGQERRRLGRRAIIAAREEGGPFASIWDFTERVDPQVVEQARARVARQVRRARLDRRRRARGCSTCSSRRSRLGRPRSTADRLRGPGLDLRPRRRDADAAARRATIRRSRPSEFEKSELLRAREGDARPLRLRASARRRSREQLRRKTDCTLAELERRRDGEIVTVGGIVSALKQLTTKKGEPMVFLRLDDLTGRRRGRRLQLGLRRRRASSARPTAMLVVKGRVDHKQEGETKLIALEVTAFEAMPERREVRLKVDARQRAGGRRSASSRRSCATSRARRPVVARARDLRGPEDARVRAGLPGRSRCPDFFAEAKALLGEAAVV